MAEIVKLAARPTAKDEARTNVIALLKAALVEAENGEIEGIVILTKIVPGSDLLAPGAQWAERASSTENFSEWIGRLEILKADWIAQARPVISK